MGVAHAISVSHLGILPFFICAAVLAEDKRSKRAPGAVQSSADQSGESRNPEWADEERDAQENDPARGLSHNQQENRREECQAGRYAEDSVGHRQQNRKKSGRDRKYQREWRGEKFQNEPQHDNHQSGCMGEQ